MTAFVVQGHIQYERESHVMFQTKNILGQGVQTESFPFAAPCKYAEYFAL